MGSRAKEILTRWPVFEIGVAIGALAVFLTLAPFGGFDTIVGDNIAQVAYWRILVNRELVGSLGASSMKPGLIALFGSAHDLSNALFGSTILIQVVCAGAAAALVTVIAGIAKEAAGLLAGVAAAVYATTETYLAGLYTQGSSMIVFLPLLAGGLWAFARQRRRAGAVLLCLAALVRIEAFAVLLWIAVAEQLLRRRYREFIVTSALAAFTVALTVACYYLVQGSPARFNAGGPGVGYIALGTSTAWDRTLRAIPYLWEATYENAVVRCGVPCLAIPALIGLEFHPQRRAFLAILGIPAFLLVYIISGEGHPETRYFEFLLPVLVAFGAAGVAYAYRAEVTRASLASVKARAMAALGVGAFGLLVSTREWRLLGSLGLVVVALGLGTLLRRFGSRPVVLRVAQGAAAVGLAWLLFVGLRDLTSARPRGRAVYTQDSIAFLEQRVVPRGKRVLLDDDIIYGTMVRDFGYLAGATALQYFAIQEEARRAAMLAATDYVVLAKGRHSWYFLRYDPLARGDKDPFRARIRKASQRSKPVTVYGRRLVPTLNSRRWLVLRVDPE